MLKMCYCTAHDMTCACCRPVSMVNAAKAGNVAAALTMLVAGTYIHLEERDEKTGGTTLFWAASWGDYELVHRLLQKGAYIEAKNNRDATPLLVAVDRGREDVASLLVAKGANVNAKTDVVDTASHIAAYRKRPSLVRLLVNAGANLTLQNAKGKTPLHVAIATRCEETIRIFQEAMPRNIDEPKRPAHTVVHSTGFLTNESPVTPSIVSARNELLRRSISHPRRSTVYSCYFDHGVAAGISDPFLYRTYSDDLFTTTNPSCYGDAPSAANVLSLTDISSFSALDPLLYRTCSEDFVPAPTRSCSEDTLTATNMLSRPDSYSSRDSLSLTSYNVF